MCSNFNRHMHLFSDYRSDGGRRSSNEVVPGWQRPQHNSHHGPPGSSSGAGGLGLKSFTNPRPDKEIKYQNRIPPQPLDNRPVLKYSTFHHNSPAKQTGSPSHKLPASSSASDPIWLPRQYSSDSHGSSQSLSRTRGGSSGGHVGGVLPGNCNNNNNLSRHGSRSNTPSPQHQPYCRVGVSPSPTCDSPGVRDPLLPKPLGVSAPSPDPGSTYTGVNLPSGKDSPLKSNGTLIL